MPSSNVFYLPSNLGLADLVSGWKDYRVLVIGPFKESHSTDFADLHAPKRICNPRLLSLPTGYYIHDIPGRRGVVIVERGTEPTPPRECARDYESQSDPLVISSFLVEDLWDESALIDSEHKFSIRSIVQLAGQVPAVSNRGHVISINPTPNGIWYTVDFNGRRQEVEESGLVPYHGTATDALEWIEDSPSNNRDIAASLTYIKLTNPLTDTLYSVSSSKTIYRAYQYKPALKLLSNDLNGILIADEVGLGKTIEAGIIWNELDYRSQLKNVLIVVPANLTDKWQLEMRRRFDRDVRKLTKYDFDQLITDIEEDRETDLIGIASMQMLRSYENFEKLLELGMKFGLVIIDEAHHMRNASAMSYDMGRFLTSMAETSVLLSATPVNLASRDLFNVLHMLSEGDFPTFESFEEQLEPNQILNECARDLFRLSETNGTAITQKLMQLNVLPYGQTITQQYTFERLLEILKTITALDYKEISEARRILADLSLLSSIFTRTRKVDVPNRKALRQPIPVEIHWSPVERNYYEALQRVLHEEALRNGHVVSWAIQMPLRQAASCLPASLDIIKNKRGISYEDIEEIDFELSDKDAAKLAESAIGSSAHLVQAMAALAPQVSHDSKYAALVDILQKSRKQLNPESNKMPPVLLFSFFTKTLEYLFERLSKDGFNVKLMYGKTPQRERTKLIQEFRNGKFDILLVSEVGSEGLDFEFCNVLVNYDLPWNPMKVEQRIGRLDRFGQEHERIFIYNFTIADTIEGEILNRLFNRIDLFHNTVGDLDPILLKDLEKLSTLTLDPNRTPDELRKEADRLSIALNNQEQLLRDLDSNRGLLLGLDSAAIAGWDSADAPQRGRYIGNSELLNLMEYSLPLFDSSIQQLPGSNPEHQRFRIHGSGALLTELNLRTDLRGGTTYGLSELKIHCENRDWIEVTLSSDYASKYDAELLSVRHPLVRVILGQLEKSLNRTRFGSGALATIKDDSEYLVMIYLAHATGTRPKVELWPFAVNVRTGELDAQLADDVMTAISERKLEAWEGLTPRSSSLKALVETAAQAMREKSQVERARLQNDNFVTVQRKIETVTSAGKRKIEGIQARSHGVSDQKITRMNKVYARRVQEELGQKLAALRGQENMALTLEQMAVILVKGTK